MTTARLQAKRRWLSVTAAIVLLAHFPHLARSQTDTDESQAETTVTNPDQVATDDNPVAVAHPDHAADSVDVVEEVLVSGEHPGPGLWRVVKDDHELWILGTHGPLPKKMTWRSKQVEDAIAKSQEVLTAGGVEAKPNIGIFRGLFLLPAAFAAAKNPDGAKLADVLPSEAYEQWSQLKQKYIGGDQGIERWRPTFAMLQLRQKARGKSGFGDSSLVWDEVRRIARKHRVRVTETGVEQEIRIEEPRKKLKEFAKVQFDDVECFSKSIGSMESDLENLRLRANAWATGDLARLRALPARDATLDCAQILGQSLLSGELSPDSNTTSMIKKIQVDMIEALARADEKWLTMAKASLAANTTTFAVLPISKLMGSTSPLTRLRDEGYAVEEPIE